MGHRLPLLGRTALRAVSRLARLGKHRGEVGAIQSDNVAVGRVLYSTWAMDFRQTDVTIGFDLYYFGAQPCELPSG